jgi:hypothetical protein
MKKAPESAFYLVINLFEIIEHATSFHRHRRRRNRRRRNRKAAKAAATSANEPEPRLKSLNDPDLLFPNR